jgi:hypothetical protein
VLGGLAQVTQERPIPLSSLTLDCWNTGGAAFDPNTTEVDSVEIQMPACQDVSGVFDFCVVGASID